MQELVYLNNAASSWPKPREVLDLVRMSFAKPYVSHGRGMVKGALDFETLTRESLAGFFNADDPRNFVFTPNATLALNTLIQGYVSHSRRKIHVLSSTLEHNSVLRPLRTLEREGKIRLTLVPFDDRGYVTVDSVRDSIHPDTRLMVMTHASNVLGTVQDIKAIGEFLKGRGVYYIVDAAQSSGYVNINLRDLSSVDALAYTGHKALFALPGIGGFYVRDPSVIDPLIQGGTGSSSQNQNQPDVMPLKFESGTPNHPGIVSLFGGLKFIKRNGLARMERKTRAMAAHIIRGLSSCGNVTLYNRKPDLPIIPFNIEGLRCDDVSYILLNEYGIMTRSGLHCAPLVHERIDGGRGCERLSLSYMNNMAQCRRVVSAVKKISSSVAKSK